MHTKTIYFIAIVFFFLAVAASAQNQEVANPAVAEAVSLFRAGKVDEAITKLNAIVASSPNEEEAHNALGIIYSSRQEADKALEHFDKAISLKERNFKAIFNKLNLLINLKRIDDAEALLLQTAQAYPDYSNAWVNLGALQMQQGKLDDAVSSIDKAIAIDTNDFDAHFKRGQLLLLQRKYHDAKASFERALEINPNFAPARRGKIMVDEIIAKIDQGYIRVRQIVVNSAQQAQSIKTRLDNGEDFAQLAAQFSIDPSAKSGGNLGFIKKGELVSVLEDVIFKLGVGEISEVVRSQIGFHIFKREE